jgi:phosphatidylglycerophosphatase A
MVCAVAGETRRWTFARLVATWFGSGYSPIAPGTAGSLGALPLYLLLHRLDVAAYWVLTALLAGLGIWSAEQLARQTGDTDPQSVVIDEVLGVMIALGFARGLGLLAALTAWVLFRALDILKPWPISKAEMARPAGLGIMLDDLVAGLVAGLLVRIIF